VLENPEDDRDLVAGVQEIFAPDSAASLYLCAESPQQYVQHTVRLMNSPEFRVRVGAAGRTFMARYYSDPEQSAKEFSAHMLETIEETREAGNGDEGMPA